MKFSFEAKGVVPVLIAALVGFFLGQAQKSDVLVQTNNGATAVSFPAEESPVVVKGGEGPSYVVLCSEGRQMSYVGMVPSSKGDPAKNMLVFECAPSESTPIDAPFKHDFDVYTTSQPRAPGYHLGTGRFHIPSRHYPICCGTMAQSCKKQQELK